ncbi:hypothetical protein FGIG_11055 [Fasciola gigantica]|uniref:Uncharacterized protein n=1 Tax=Fasciola gigantica TaxID=46835 RepID=A0A504YWH7_FASGI|nr:hypothetical protein FGIG_11055 [Fasciola gigantica]
MNRGGSSKRPTRRGGQNYFQGSTVDNSFNSNHPSERKANRAYAYATDRRQPRGGARPNNTDSRGRGSGRGSNRLSGDHHDWHRQTGSNGDFIDRRRGSGDSDQMDMCFAADDERTDHQPVQNEHPSRKRNDQIQSGGPRREVDDGYRASKEYEPGENGGQPKGVP